MYRKLFALLIVCAVLVFAVHWNGTANREVVRLSEADEQPKIAPSHRIPAGFEAENSCSARGCHGKVELHGVKGSEYSIWLQKDPHSAAYSTLAGVASARIEKILARKDGVLREAVEDERCLACHATPRVGKSQTGAEVHTAGVSCEACHGAAGDWVESHVAVDWAGAKNRKEQYKALGMRWLGEPIARGAACVGCHVGAPAADDWPLARQATHDLYAAGHPRLHFELFQYLEAMPRHWDAGRRRAEEAATEWAAGQWSAALTATRLLETQSASVVGPGDYGLESCFRCHHGLNEKNSLARNSPEGFRPLGDPGWGSPYLQSLELAALFLEKPGGGGAIANQRAIVRLQTLMRRPKPDPKQVEAAAAELIRCLSALRNIARPEIPNDLPKTAPPRDWDEAAQRYLLGAAVSASLKADLGKRNRLFRRLSLPLLDGASPDLRLLLQSLRFPLENGGLGPADFYHPWPGE